ncbi:cytochrome P450 [Flavobacterium sp. ZS1P14]|uniref:cytochrome P450 n=1 Tax=Flavobacterium sp. ZS1P14 TaxID=3401729 RepID=UPI003AAEC7BC
MTTSLFLQSEIKDPYRFYQTMHTQNPVYWDEKNQIWALYSYDACEIILKSSFAHIPEINSNNEQGLNNCALQISNQLARLSNGIQHDIAREVAMLLFSNMNITDTSEIMEKLLLKRKNESELDWVNLVCKQLPILVVLKSFDFDANDYRFVCENIEQLIKIMMPNKTQEQVQCVNAIAERMYTIVKKKLVDSGLCNSFMEILSEKYQMGKGEIMSLLASNLIGLFIQSYDACRGLLSNSLLQIVKMDHPFFGESIENDWMQNVVIETLRYDSPIHTTRRVAVQDIFLNDVVIKKGEKILLVLAAANRDSKRFSKADTFDITRINNGEHLTFGIGGHECLAKHFSVRLTTDALLYLFRTYTNIKVLEKKIEYEPLSNVRLSKNLLISI